MNWSYTYVLFFPITLEWSSMYLYNKTIVVIIPVLYLYMCIMYKVGVCVVFLFKIVTIFSGNYRGRFWLIQYGYIDATELLLWRCWHILSDLQKNKLILLTITLCYFLQICTCPNYRDISKILSMLGKASSKYTISLHNAKEPNQGKFWKAF